MTLSSILTDYPLEAIGAELSGIEHTTDPSRIRRKSQDYNAISPLLRQMLADKRADMVVTPKTQEEVRRTIQAAVRYRTPITVRGGGTANYGQSVPLKGGIVLDMTAYSGVVLVEPGRLRARSGTRIAEIEDKAHDIGWEMRFIPTTRNRATIGGHLAGGQGGPGSAVYGTWRDRGNLLGASVMTMEEEPRVIELRGRDAQLIHHTYGATGVVLEIEAPLAPAWPWIEAVAAFPDYMQAVRFGIDLANAAGIVRKMVSVQGWPTPRLFGAFGDMVPEGCSIVSTMIAEQTWEDFEQFVAEAGGMIASKAPEGQGPYGAPLTEFVFGHALVQILKTDSRRAVLEGFFRDSVDLAGLIERVHDKVGRYGPMRVELVRISGELVGTGSPYFVYESPEQMAQIVREMQEGGAVVSNSHTSNVRAVGKKEIAERDLAFKRDVDPYGLLNPGRFEADSEDDASFRFKLPTDSWTRRLG
jgi:FAD/FMN-containing dehydrogenase